MHKLAIILSLAALGGCAVAPPGPPNYGTRAYAQPADPSQWHVVSVTPVAPGTGARAAEAGETGVTTSDTMGYNPAPTVVGQPVYVQQPVYVPTPVYAAPPLYADPYYWYPPISIGLGFNFGRGWGGHRGGWGGHRGGWGGARVGGSFRGHR
jgi:hypothetical protein